MKATNQDYWGSGTNAAPGWIGATAGAATTPTRRRVIAGGAAAAGAAGGAWLAAACGGTATPAGVSGSTSSLPYKVIVGDKFGAQGTPPERIDWRDRSNAEFNRIYGPKLTVEHIVLADLTAIVAALAANTGPDVTLSSGAWFSDLADKNQLHDITQYVKRDKVDMSRWYVQDEVINRKGKQYALPFWTAAGTYFYNKTLFTRAGLKPPDNATWTWNDMLDAAQKLTKPNESWGISMSYGFEFAWINFLRSAGEDWLNKDKSKTTLNTPGAVETFQWLVDLVRKYRVMAAPNDTTVGTGNLWQQGKVGINLGGNGGVGSTIGAKVDFEWDIFVTPKHPKVGKRGISANENPWVATKDTKNPEAAYKLIAFYSDSFSDGLVGKNRINMPSLKSAAADPQGWLATPPASMKLSLETIKDATSLGFHLNWNDWNTEITKPLVKAFTGELGVKEACDQASQTGDSLLRGA